MKSVNDISPILDGDGLDTNKIYFYTDGCLKNQYGSWSVIGLAHDGREWKRIVTLGQENVPAKDSGEMELFAIREALKVAQADFSDKPVMLRTDSQGLQRTVGHYLDCFNNAFSGADFESQLNQKKRAIRARYERNGHAVAYKDLFDRIDSYACQGDHHTGRFSIEWVSRDHDRWIKLADSTARSANPAFH